jgi:hypothetical protein
MEHYPLGYGTRNMKHYPLGYGTRNMEHYPLTEYLVKNTKLYIRMSNRLVFLFY